MQRMRSCRRLTGWAALRAGQPLDAGASWRASANSSLCFSAFTVLALAACSANNEGIASRPGPVAAGASAPGAAAGTGTGTGGASGSSAADNPTAIVNSGGVGGPAAGATAGSSGAAGMSGTAGAGQCTSMFCQNSEPDAIDCGTATLTTNLKVVEKPGNILVIFDRSTSMEMDWNGTPRYLAVGNAFLGAIKPIQHLLQIGAVFFPSPAGTAAARADCPAGCNLFDPAHTAPGGCCDNGLLACAVNTIDQADQIPFGPATTFVTDAPMKWRLASLVMAGAPSMGGTPLGGGVTRANEAIMATKFTDPLAVVILTDGVPNCGTDGQAVLNTVQSWHMKGIATHVIGIPGAQGAADVLNSLAAAGGTSKYIDPASPMELETRLRTILQSTVRAGIDSCTIQLERATALPADLALIATVGGVDSGIARDLSTMQGWNAGDGWNVNSAGDTVTLTGRLCDLAKDGTYEKLRFVYGCPKPPPPPPPPPPPRID